MPLIRKLNINMRNLLLAFLSLSLFACNHDNSTADAAIEADTSYITIDSTGSFLEDGPESRHLIWSPMFDSVKGDMVLKKVRQVNADTLEAEKLIQEINSAWDGIRLEFKKISHDTIYVAVPESEKLTGGLGSSGAFSYMSSTTFTLTEIRNIRFVNFEFGEGAHLAPGTMKRSDFED